MLDSNIQASAQKAVVSLKKHLETQNLQHEPIYLIIDTELPTCKRKEFTPRIIPLTNRIGKVSNSKIFLITKDPVSLYREPLVGKDSATDNVFTTIIAFRKFKSISHSRKSTARVYHDNDFILIDHRLHKFLPDLLHGTIFQKSSKKYPIMIQMARPSADAKLTQSKKSTKMKDERVDPDYLLRQVKMICRSTTFVPSTGKCLSIVVGFSDMSSEKLVQNINSILEYLTNAKFQPVGGVISGGMAGILDLHLKTATTWLFYVIKQDFSFVHLPSLNSSRLKELYSQSLEASHYLDNNTNLILQEARLKPATNSYVKPRFPLHSKQISHIHLENATLLMLCRNWELPEVLKSMRSMEDKFNRDYHYPWVFLNDVNFTGDFISQTTNMATGPTSYGLIPENDWNTPDSINKTRYAECLKDYIKNDVIYGGSRSYRNMCRFNSGFFFRQDLLLSYDYYFRVEPGIEYFCDFQMDPFRLMKDNGKKYGFVISLLEYPDTIPTLWDTVEDFLHEHPEYQNTDSAVDFITTKEPIGPKTVVSTTDSPYNMCHFWSNFEIGDLNFFRSKEYLDYFNYLSQNGGFYYERWGDAPVHSIAASLLLNKDEIMHFEDIGYTHTPFFTFPDSLSMRSGKRCLVPEGEKNIDILAHSCLPRWWRYGSGKRFMREYFYEEEYI
ncbi:hypothetical protein FOA43_000067 [Brettanomyces nanus]|uniref:Uncharacterized protein n=1 Tax=Eeniella nana TaxID=13502 RepID=A0A875RVV5_EENNA|nr:uncharacterized protein FOA43_000067 [Brettanomyces nanus]QPG72766.1 hypothetical protein FOA43_000067 [Brettanomyces nanus]